MTDPRPRAPRRTDALTSARIVDAAIARLDAAGIEALTFRTLAADLATGAGAIYHHVTNKGELLAAAATETMREVTAATGGADPEASIRALALGVFDALRDHPWLATQLVAAPWQPAVLQLFDRMGSEVAALGVPDADQFHAASALVHHVLGVASQYDAGSRSVGAEIGRSAFFESATSPLVRPDDDRFPFLSRIEQQLVAHDDRQQFEAGIGIILAGIDALRRGRARATGPESRHG